MHQLALDLFLPSPVYSPQDLVLGNCNFSVFQWLERWPQWPTSVMAMYGPSHSGKSHFAHLWQQKAQAQLWDMHQFEEKPWDQQLFNAEILHFCIQGIPQQEENFLHFFNALQQKGGYLLLIDRLPPAHWNIGLPDLKSRLNALPALGIDQPDEEFLTTLLIKLFSEQQLKISRDMIDFIIRRLPRSFEAAHLLVQYIRDSIDPISLSMVKNILIKVDQSIKS